MPRRVRPITVHPMALRNLEVTAVADITPALRRVTLTGPDLVDFSSAGFDDDVKLFFAYPGQTEPVLPTIVDGGIRFPKEPSPLVRTYTIRAWRPEAGEHGEVDIDFVKHGVGVATTWAYRTRPGESVHMVGPTLTKGLPAGADWTLIAGDDTTVPAIARYLDELPTDAKATVFIEVAEDAHRYDILAGRDLPGVTVTWLVRHGAPGESAPLLLDAIKTLPADLWETGQCFAWIAGEQSIVRDMRRHLVGERGMDKAWIDFTGYWRKETVVAMEDDAAVPDPERNESAFSKFHEMAEILPPLAIRVAANLDLGNLISQGTTAVDDLVEATGANPTGLRKLLRYLEGLELLDPLSGPAEARTAYKLSEVGELLTNEFVLDHIRRDGVMATREQAFFGLEDAVMTGEPVFRKVTGRTWTQQRLDASFENERLEKSATSASYLAAPLAGSHSITGARDVVIHSDGAGALAAALVADDPDVRVLIPALPTQANWLREDLKQTVPDAGARKRIQIVEQSVFEPTMRADTIIIAHELGNHPDADAVLLLRRAAESLTKSGRILLIQPTFGIVESDGPSEHGGEADLLNLTVVGGGHRTPTELEALVEAAGLRVASAESVGWGTVVRTLGRA
ncbi:MAG: SIP domain-containing protein [Corynebacterium sp.]|uniref:Siderophore-interacting protein n=2 Tax=Corynebacterium TaxID=1716 RepID=G0HH46_CORVD|nr:MULTISPECIES: siderophore-interacting protein [Corynebacterium]AEK38196.1 siderophore-interacting protein [Corynebacterium variabile DSM 44702]MDN5723744.1 SIP domain-containing protein [Corynebacterium sp.]MDN6283111.1 SIP domain-containing protein [Corynebacterium sp.]MDN6306036.1 SIP domain-containing protein [Corynebacterium sp.]MDN6368183.1 SIP domain-containing protein [Corynebacterium sp.]